MGFLKRALVAIMTWNPGEHSGQDSDGPQLSWSEQWEANRADERAYYRRREEEERQKRELEEYIQRTRIEP